MVKIVIKAEKVCCQSGQHYLLKDIDWEVKQGEHWIVFGLNGSGKTTLLSAIAGYKQHTAGKLEVLGQVYDDTTLFSLSKQIGWVSASFFDKYYSSETVLCIVLSGLFGTLGIGAEISDQDVQKARALLEQWHIGHKSDMPFSMLSKGEQQNVLIARALISDPKILVLDEPGTGLDVFARENLLQWVKLIAETTETTIIYVTHYPEEIQPCFEKCLLLQHGQVLANGSIDEVFQSDVLSNVLGEPVMVQKNENGTVMLQRKNRKEEDL